MQQGRGSSWSKPPGRTRSRSRSPRSESPGRSRSSSYEPPLGSRTCSSGFKPGPSHEPSPRAGLSRSLLLSPGSTLQVTRRPKPPSLDLIRCLEWILAGLYPPCYSLMKKSLKSLKSYARGPKQQRKSYKSQRGYQILRTNFYHNKFQSICWQISHQLLGRLQQTSVLQ